MIADILQILQDLKTQPLASNLTTLPATVQADFIAHSLARAIRTDLPAVLAIEYAGLNPVSGPAQAMKSADALHSRCSSHRKNAVNLSQNESKGGSDCS
ncbi:MAG: hypothetical protein J2P21_25965 [Chloracidobacterium sp.]|nr:hypothetical protein [Chloracidobacterium sp.]